MHEVELKLALDKPFRMPRLEDDGVGIAAVRPLPPLKLRAVYHDTDDLRLARNGITLRWRSGDDVEAAWTLKLPVPEEDGAVRRELTFEGSHRSLPGDARDLVTAFTRSAPLEAVARLQTRRRRWVLVDEDGEEVAEVSDDNVSLLRGGRTVTTLRELEIEARTADRARLDALASRLRAPGASPASPVPKLVQLLGADAAAPPDLPPPRAVDPGEPAAAAVAVTIAAGAHRLVWNDPGVRLGEVEPVHQMRVAARRLRSDLRTLAPLVDPAWAEPLTADLRWLGGVLGDVRDADVMQAHLARGAAGLEEGARVLLEALANVRETNHAVLLDVLRGPRYLAVVDRLVGAVAAPQVTDAAGRPCAEALPPLAHKAWRRAARWARALGPDATDEDLHRARILTKRTRYAAEAVAPALGARGAEARAFAKRAAAVQDALGSLQDTAVARATIEGVALSHSADGALNMVLGRLIERQHALAQQARADFRAAWAKLDRKKLRGWMRA